MKQILKLFSVIMFMAIAANSYAAKNEDITLIVTSDGVTKDEAIKNALRSAIEQTYGVFVSANTELLDDEIVKDDIASVSSGNIKKYRELALTHSNDKECVTLEVVVSKGKLLSYAKSKGAECELDGESMFADIQLQELYARNEEKLFENLCNEVEHLLLNGYDYKVDVKRVQSPYYHSGSENNVYFEVKISIKLNEQGEFAWNKLLTTLKDVGRSYDPNSVGRIGLFGSRKVDESPEFLGVVRLTKLTKDYNGMYYDYDGFKVRSEKTAGRIQLLDSKIPYLVKNISIKYGGKQLDISNQLKLPEEYSAYNAPPSCLIATRCYSRKKGSNCGEYVYLLKIAPDELKDIKKITVATNDKIKSYNNSFYPY